MPGIVICQRIITGYRIILLGKGLRKENPLRLFNNAGIWFIGKTEDCNCGPRRDMTGNLFYKPGRDRAVEPVGGFCDLVAYTKFAGKETYGDIIPREAGPAKPEPASKIFLLCRNALNERKENGE